MVLERFLWKGLNVKIVFVIAIVMLKGIQTAMVFVTVRDDIPYDWKTQTSEWNVEDDRKWKTEDTDKFFYGIEETKDD